MGAMGCNPSLMPDGMPIVGKGVPSRLVIYHQGSLPGALSAVALMPETETAIVVMSNSLALNDSPDVRNIPFLSFLLLCSVAHLNCDISPC
jgi:hypothetical protein